MLALLLACEHRSDSASGSRKDSDSPALLTDTSDSTPSTRWVGTGSTADASVRLYADSDAARFGYSAFYLPDVDGDGRDELVIPYSDGYDAAEPGAIAVYFGGHAGSGLDDDADLRLYADDGGVTAVTWGDFDDDGTPELLALVDYRYQDWYVAWFPVTRLGETEVSTVLHAVPNGAEVWEFGAETGWRRGEQPDVLVLQDRQVPGGDCYHLYVAPIQARTLDGYDAVIRSDDVWTDCLTSSTAIGDVTGTGLSSFGFKVEKVQLEGKNAAGIAVFDSVPDGDATLSDADHSVYNTDLPVSPSTADESGDLDADGYADLLLWAMAPGDEEAVTCALVIPGPLTDVTNVRDAPTRICPTDGADSWEVGGGDAGDFDGDGYQDITTNSRLGEASVPAALVFYGPITAGSHTAADSDLAIWGDAGANWTSPTVHGDFSGDGRSDMVVGVPYEMNDDVMSGAVYLFYGR